MRRNETLTAVVLAAGAAVGLTFAAPTARAATADFHLVQHAVVVDQAAGTATFSLSFDREPQFFPTGGGVEQADAFQIEVDADKNTFEEPIGFDDIDAVVRGAEIADSDGIPVRAPDGDGGAGNTGGWGPIRAVLPYELDGATLTFTSDLATLGDADGRFRYRIITIDSSGTLTGETNAAIIPLPAAVWGGAMLLGAAAVAVKRRLAR